MMARIASTSKAVVVATKTTTASIFVPKKGDRKTRMAVLTMLLFLAINVWAMTAYKVEIVEVLKLNADFMWKVLSVFIAGNGIEAIASGFGGKANKPPSPASDPNDLKGDA